ncbi:MAG: MFS transporter [Scytonema sp. RU_4_4]|nr:MFS transporter [Scytonema sp. RU_4_4]NJR73984.1 MFS transporter [Scytonema sp. CRU_2_7]
MFSNVGIEAIAVTAPFNFFLSQVGNQIAAVAIPILVLQFTHSAIATGIAGAGNIIPIVLAVFVGGKAIDQFGAWRVSVAADVLSGISVLLLPLVFIGFKSVSAIAIFLLVFVGALFDPTATSARQTLVPKFAKLARIPLEKVNGYRGSLENGADLLGPVVGAGLINLIGTVNTFFVNAASFFICAVMFAIALLIAPLPQVWQLPSIIAFWISVALTIISGVIYLLPPKDSANINIE